VTLIVMNHKIMSFLIQIQILVWRTS